MLLTFLHDLVSHGRVVVTAAPETESDTAAELENAIREVDAAARLELAHAPPGLSVAAAVWALSFIERACRFFVYREFDEQTITAAMEAVCPAAPATERCYSADLFLRYLPEIARMARGVGANDPLVGHLQRTAGQWPLSSVGMPGIACEPGGLDSILSNASLCQLYIDRIIERGDTTRLAQPAVREAVRIALGAYPSLAPELSRAMTGIEEQG